MATTTKTATDDLQDQVHRRPRHFRHQPVGVTRAALENFDPLVDRLPEA